MPGLPGHQCELCSAFVCEANLTFEDEEEEEAPEAVQLQPHVSVDESEHRPGSALRRKVKRKAAGKRVTWVCVWTFLKEST